MTIYAKNRLLNECRWSSSREATFLECRKKYWYTYYGAWEGWPKTSFDSRSEVDPLASYLYMLKNMQPACMFVGSVVHKTIEWCLKTYEATKRLPTLEEVRIHVQNGVKKGIQESSQKMWKNHPKHHTNLLEHYYNLPFDSSPLEEKARSCVDNWYSSACLQKIALNKRAAWKGIESMQTFSLEEGVEAIVVYDFFLIWHARQDDSFMIIFDWKTGQESEKVETQLLAYAIAAKICFSVPLDKLILSPFYLSQGPQGYKKYGAKQEMPIDSTKIEELKKSIVSSAKAMLELHPRKNAEGIFPTPTSLQFPYTEDRRHCKKCSFQELCQATNYQEKEKEELGNLVKEKFASCMR
jgi:hypothetical protein